MDPLSVCEWEDKKINDVSSKSTLGKFTNCLGQIRELDVIDLKSLLPYKYVFDVIVDYALRNNQNSMVKILTTEVAHFLSGNLWTENRDLRSLFGHNLASSGVKIVVLQNCYDSHYYANIAIIDRINSKLIALDSVIEL